MRPIRRVHLPYVPIRPPRSAGLQYVGPSGLGGLVRTPLKRQRRAIHQPGSQGRATHRQDGHLDTSPAGTSTVLSDQRSPLDDR